MIEGNSQPIFSLVLKKLTFLTSSIDFSSSSPSLEIAASDSNIKLMLNFFLNVCWLVKLKVINLMRIRRVLHLLKFHPSPKILALEGEKSYKIRYTLKFDDNVCLISN
jgi:hypothetical protein